MFMSAVQERIVKRQTLQLVRGDLMVAVQVVLVIMTVLQVVVLPIFGWLPILYIIAYLLPAVVAVVHIMAVLV